MKRLPKHLRPIELLRARPATLPTPPGGITLVPLTAEIKLDQAAITEACLAYLKANGWRAVGKPAVVVKRGYSDPREQTATPDTVEVSVRVEQMPKEHGG